MSDTTDYENCSLDDLMGALATDDFKEAFAEGEATYEEEQTIAKLDAELSAMELAIKKNKSKGFVSVPFTRVEMDCGKKQYIGLPVGWQKTTMGTIPSAKGCSGLVILTGEKSNLTVLDIDTKPLYHGLVAKHPELMESYTVESKNGYHLYFKYHPLLKNTNGVFKSSLMVDIKNDGGSITCPPTRYHLFRDEYFEYEHFCGTEVVDFPQYILDELKPEAFKEEPKMTNGPASEPEPEPEPTNTKLQTFNMITKAKIVDLIDIKYNDDYNHWLRIMWAMKREGYTREFAVNFSKKSARYTDEGMVNAWDYAPEPITLSQGTINHYAKLSDEDAYNSIIQNLKPKYNFGTPNDSMMTDIVMDHNADDFVYNKTGDNSYALYVYFKGRWQQSDNLAMALIKTTLNNFFANEISKEQKKLAVSIENDDDDEDSKRIKNLVRCQGHCLNITTLKNILSFLKVRLSTRFDNIKFDVSLPNVFCFKNIAFDIMTGEEVKIRKDHYITLNSGADFKQPTEEQIAYVGKLFNDVHPDPEMLKHYNSVLLTALSAHRPEHFFMANGCGRNGKGMINELMIELMGDDYAKMANITLLTKPQKNGPNPELANLDKKRFVVFTEPNDTDVLQLGNIKSYTGGGKIDARKNYSNESNVELHGTFLLEVNQKPTINGRIDDSIVGRFVNINFPTYFTDDKKDLANLPHAKPKDIKLKDYQFREEHRCALFIYLLRNAPKQLFIPACVQKATREYLLNNDEFLNWFEENYEEREGAILTVKELFHHYKNSGYYQDLNKADRRKLTEKSFRENRVMTNIKLRNYYYERKNINEKYYRNIVLNYALKEVDENMFQAAEQT